MPDIVDRATVIGLLQNTDDLGLDKLRLTQGNLLAKRWLLCQKVLLLNRLSLQELTESCTNDVGIRGRQETTPED